MRIIILLWLLLTGCQLQPTSVTYQDTEITNRMFDGIRIGEDEEVDIVKSVIIDARPRFQHELAKPPRSFHMFWKDWELFNYSGAALSKRRIELQRRLAIKGIDPLTSIVIFGQGKAGQGEEYYLAALLFALGIDKITVTSPRTFSQALVNSEVEPVGNLPFWERPLRYNFSCESRQPGHRIVVKSAQAMIGSQFRFDQGKINKFAKQRVLNAIEVKDDLFAYGMALSLLRDRFDVCVKI